MSLIFVHRPRLAYTLLTRTRPSRCISSISHFTQAERDLFFEHLEARDRLPRQPIAQKPPTPQFLRPQIHHPQSSTWIAQKNKIQGGLQRGSVLKLVSWNINWSSPGPATRASAALEHLNTLFGEDPGPLVVMLQEVRHESLQAIMENPWVQQNFVLSNVSPPESHYTYIPGESFILNQLEWKAAPYFTLTMISKHLAITNCFRVPFLTMMGRDALVVDIPIINSGGQTHSRECIRLCTTHLESLWPGKVYRPGQLALISALLKGTLSMDSRVIAGIVGGDMNAIDRAEHDLHKASEVNLKDVREDISAPPVPVLKPFQKDSSYCRARGNTWGYQSGRTSSGKRMDKFLYTGLIETVAPNETQDVAGRLGRLGIGLKTEVEAWEEKKTEVSLVRGKLVEKPHIQYYSSDRAARLRDMGLLKDAVPTKINIWASDHFGITVGIKIL